VGLTFTWLIAPVCMLALASLRSSSTTQSALNAQRSARSARAFSIAVETISFDKFWAPITCAVLAL
jgi:hypothetical protein